MQATDLGLWGGAQLPKPCAMEQVGGTDHNVDRKCLLHWLAQATSSEHLPRAELGGTHYLIF